MNQPHQYERDRRKGEWRPNQAQNLSLNLICLIFTLSLVACVKPRPRSDSAGPEAASGASHGHGANGASSIENGEPSEAWESQGKTPYDVIQAEATSMAELKGHRLVTLAIVGTNDIHGTLTPLPQKHEKTIVGVGGLSYVASYIDVLRAELGSRIIWLDGGDEFQGTLDSNLGLGAPMVDAFNIAGLNAAALGNHEFDFGLPALQARLQQAHYPYLAANLNLKGKGQQPEWKNLSRSTLLEVDGISIGVIGLTTRETPIRTIAAHVETLEFNNLVQATVNEAKVLRSRGAKIILATGHVGLNCDIGRARVRPALRKESDPLGPCDANDEMAQLLKALPEGTVDAVVSGHSHTVVHHWVSGVPVIQGGSLGRYINVVYLTYDKQTGQIVAPLTRIEGPIPVCPKVFQKSQACDLTKGAAKVARGPLVDTVFHGQTIEENSAIAKYLQPLLEKNAALKNRHVGIAQDALPHQYDGNSPLGNLAADAIREASGADIAVFNSGGVRAPISAGPVTYETVFRSFPFENAIVVLKVTGRELQNILRTAESGFTGFFAVSGLRLKLTAPSVSAPLDDLNRDGKTEPWESNRLLSVRLDDGSTIHPKRSYRLATIDFLYNGGDGMAWAMKSINKKNVEYTTLVMRDAVAAYFDKRPEGVKVEPLRLAANGDERLVFEERALAEGTKRGKTRKR